mgnify:CR=1 FL=1
MDEQLPGTLLHDGVGSRKGLVRHADTSGA